MTGRNPSLDRTELSPVGMCNLSKPIAPTEFFGCLLLALVWSLGNREQPFLLALRAKRSTSDKARLPRASLAWHEGLLRGLWSLPLWIPLF